MKRRIVLVALVCSVLGSSYAADQYQRSTYGSDYSLSNSSVDSHDFDQFRSVGTRDSSESRFSGSRFSSPSKSTYQQQYQPRAASAPVADNEWNEPSDNSGYNQRAVEQSPVKANFVINDRTGEKVYLDGPSSSVSNTGRGNYNPQSSYRTEQNNYQNDVQNRSNQQSYQPAAAQSDYSNEQSFVGRGRAETSRNYEQSRQIDSRTNSRYSRQNSQYTEPQARVSQARDDFEEYSFEQGNTAKSPRSDRRWSDSGVQGAQADYRQSQYSARKESGRAMDLNLGDNQYRQASADTYGSKSRAQISDDIKTNSNRRRHSVDARSSRRDKVRRNRTTKRKASSGRRKGFSIGNPFRGVSKMVSGMFSWARR